MFSKKRQYLFILIVLFLPVFLVATNTVEIAATGQAPNLDGKLDDDVWQTAAKFTTFKTYNPDYKKDPSQKTVVYLAYDEDNLYVAFRCFDTEPDKIKATVSKRDTLVSDDWVGFVLDTFYDRQTAFAFILNPLGIQTDGMMNLQGNLDASMDMVWYSKGVVNEDGYSVECRVPSKSIRFPGRKKFTMGVMFFRSISRTSEETSCPMITPEGGAILSQTQPIQLSGLKYKRVIEILPAFTHSRGSSNNEGQMKADPQETDISLTTKIGVTPEITFDGTYNPDFSQVEADAGQIDVNLRYSLFYPEKRPFFLEGQENFNFSGNTEEAPLVALVHTRTISDPSLGLKLSGRVGRKTSFTTLFAIDTAPGKEKDESGNYLYEGENAYFPILRMRYALKDDSYLGGFYTGREFMNDYNRVVGADGRLRLSQYSVLGFHALGSFSAADNSEPNSEFGHAMALRYEYSDRKWIFDLGIQDLSENFRVDTGFVTRKNITRLAAFGMYRIYPKSEFFQRIEPFYWSYHIYDKESDLIETLNLFTLRFWLPRQTMFRIDLIAGNEVFASQRFNRNAIGMNSQSQITKHVLFGLFYRYSGAIYYDPDEPYQGKGSRLGFSLSYQPFEQLTSEIDISYADFFRSSDSQKIYDYTIMRNRTTFQINKYLFFRSIVEYNTYHKRLMVDLLASFTYIPGTVIHFGYGTIFEKIRWLDREYVNSDHFLETQRGLFFKISYLWRL
ncbi:MAG: carbohydrate binding family 9 domain-containing protein [Candidatus Aminicenantes bacterium]|nr:carbohydrate binding family 9 domain-containing protein [Candidatus Aminicenantes bacterium]